MLEIEPTFYTPVVRWKQGEYLAHSALDPEIAKFVLPHIVLPPPKESCVDGPRLASEKLMAVNGVLAVMCPACSRGAHGRWPRWMSAGWGLIRSSGSKPLTSSG